jgi:hypothetical protein
MFWRLEALCSTVILRGTFSRKKPLSRVSSDCAAPVETTGGNLASVSQTPFKNVSVFIESNEFFVHNS